MKWLYISKNLDTSQKARQFLLRFFIYKNLHTLRLHNFHGFLKFEEVGAFLLTKNTSLSVTFYIQKTVHFPLRLYIQKA